MSSSGREGATVCETGDLNGPADQALEPRGGGGEMPPVAVVTVTYGERFHLVRQVIAAALECGVAKVIVVANGATAQAAALVLLANNAKGAVHILSLPKNLGSAGGYRAGLEYARNHGDCDFIWLLDDDNLPEPDALRVLLAQHALLRREIPDDRLALVCYRNSRKWRRLKQGIPPRLVFQPGSSFCDYYFLKYFLRWIRKLRRAILMRWRDLFGGRVCPEVVAIPYAPWGGLFLHRRVLDSCGLPDERFFLYWDDREFTNRLVQVGGRIYLIFSSVVHDIEPRGIGPTRPRPWILMGKSDLRAYYHVRNGGYFGAHCRTASRLLYALNKYAFLSTLMVQALLRRRWSRYVLIRRAVRDGEAGRLGPAPSITDRADAHVQEAGFA